MDTYAEGTIPNGTFVDVYSRGVWQNQDHQCQVVKCNVTRGAYVIREMRHETTFLAPPNDVIRAGTAKHP